MNNKFIVTLMLTFLLPIISWGDGSIRYGFVSRDVTAFVIKKQQKPLEDALHQFVHFAVFESDLLMQQFVHEHPKDLALLYVKVTNVPLIKQQKDWKSLMVVNDIDAETHRLSKDYKMYIVTAKKASIKSLADLHDKTLVYYNKDSVSNYIAVRNMLQKQHIQNIHWVKALDWKQAIKMIDDGKADAMGLWHMHYIYHDKRANFKVIAEQRIQNPQIFVNQRQLTTSQIKVIKNVLKSFYDNPANLQVPETVAS